jgi:NAD(P)-dependent dehydrogenase (short-subunit alcohol dehydrogenase family)
MTETPTSSPFFSEPRGVLILRADTALGQALTLSLARPNARLALSCQTWNNTTFWETIPRLLQSGAIVLPLEEKGGPFNSDTAESLVERVVEDFGRLDLVVCPLEIATGNGTASVEEAVEEATRRARAARPHLRRARPTGFFLMVTDAPLSQGFPLEEATAALAREMATGPQGRPRVLTLDLQKIFQNLSSHSEDPTHLREWIGNLLDNPAPTGAHFSFKREEEGIIPEK